MHVKIGMGAKTVCPLSFAKSKFIYGIDNAECVKILCEVECKDRGAFNKPKNIKDFQQTTGGRRKSRNRLSDSPLRGNQCPNFLPSHVAIKYC